MTYCRKKCLLFLSFLIILFLLFSRIIFASITDEECQKDLQTGREHLEECISLWAEIREEKSKQITTLNSELEKFDASIAITTAQIYKTVGEIQKLEKEISTLSTKIGHLDISLDQLSQILVRRIAETYKKGKIDVLALLLSSNNFSEFVGRYKYLRVIQLHDRKLMIQMETVRTNYSDQRMVKEEKQEELEAAKRKLDSQKVVLAQQKAAKNNLLAITKNDERKYQQLLAQAIAQQKALLKFVSGQGGATILENQTVHDDWGYYYNQRDSEWGRNSLGVSGLSVAEYGCLVSSVAMIASHYGINIKPSDIASNPSAFFSDTAYLLDSFCVNSIKVIKEHKSAFLLDSELSAGRPVIAGLYSGPNHFIVIKEKSGDNYVMHDPFLENGANRPLSDKYSVSDISSLRLISFSQCD